MEERKGVRTIINAAIELTKRNQISHLHFVLCGNKNDEAQTYLEMLANTETNEHVTFAGYRTDVAELMRSSYIGVIASTGWDSFTMSSVEMMASGLPMIVSNLQGLSETIEHEKNGYLIEPGNAEALAEKINALSMDEDTAKRFSNSSRKRAEVLFSLATQIEKIAGIIK
jgi:glycosyltransferase involved in cell wall biosynthesis